MTTIAPAAGSYTTLQILPDIAGTNIFNLAADTTVDTADWAAFKSSLHGKDSGGSASVWTLNINGTLQAQHDSTNSNGINPPDSGSAIEMENYKSTTNSKIIVGTEGSLYGISGGIDTSAALDVTNSGSITSAHNAISFNGQVGLNSVDDTTNTNDGSHSNLKSGKTVSVTNNATGDISGDFEGIGNWSQSALKVTNSGHIGGGVTHSWDVDFLGAAIHTGYNNDVTNVNGGGTLTLTNNATGVIDGNVDTNWIGDVITNLGTINGTIRSYVQNHGGIIDLNLDGNYTDFSTKGAIALSAYTGIANTITNSGTINGIANFGQDQNNLTHFFQVSMALSDGIDIVTNNLGGVINGDIWLNNGDDKLTNSGQINGFVDGGDGNNTITNTATGVIGSSNNGGGVGGGTGIDNLQNAGIIWGGVHLNDGNNIIGNTGTIHGQINLGQNNDTLTNSGTIDHWVDMGDGHNITTNSGKLLDGIGGNGGVDSIVNSGSIHGDINTNGGNDTLDNSKGTVGGWINMGAGFDTIIGGAGVEKVVDDQGGGDSYNLGAGNDILVAWGVNAGGSHYDGGAGFDTIDFSKSATSVTMDETLLTSNLSFDGGTTHATILNFENIIGSNIGDSLKGSVGADFIHGGTGADTITGGGGADQLWGGGGANQFNFATTADSTNARAGRDTIHDFVQGTDHLHFGFLAVPTQFTVNAAFHSVVGELRETFVGTQTILQIDTNGDGISDFAIAFDGHITFQASDFI